MAYRIYLPPCYGEDDHTYPALYMFHGNVSTESQWDDLGLDEAAEELILGGEIPPMIIVMAGGGTIANNSSGGPYSFEGVILNELIPHIEANYCAWPAPAGRALGGLSRGGYWSLEIAFRNASQFASVGAHSAALVDTHAGPDLNPQFTGLTHELGDLRIYMDIGADDWYIANIRRLHEDMEAAGIPHEWVLNEGIHEDAYWADHVGDYLRWYASGWPEERSAYPPCQTG
jgi:enterochelin esterase-like enzyme